MGGNIIGWLPLVLLLSAQFVNAQPYNHYRGNLHAHSAYSDGNKENDVNYDTPAECYEYAKGSDNFDFLGISEHNHDGAGMELAWYAQGLAQADSACDSSFVALYGMEWGTISGGGHVLVYGFDSLMGWDSISGSPNYDIYVAKTDYQTLFEKVANKEGAFAVVAHPSSSDYDSLFTGSYDSLRDVAIVGCSYRSGPAFSTDTTYSSRASSTYNARFKDLLKKGYHVSPTLDHDNHYTTFGRTTQGRTVVLADSLSKDDILEALEAGRFYATDDYNLEITFTCNGNYMGEVVTELADPTFTIELDDPDGSDVDYIRLRYGEPGSGSNSTILTSSSSDSFQYTHSISQGDTFYYYLEIRQNDDDRIVTSPIRFIKDNPTLLSLDILAFNAQVQDEDVLLTWEGSGTVGDFNLHGSTDGETWEHLFAVTANGGGHQFKDRHPHPGVNYYKLNWTHEEEVIDEAITTANVATTDHRLSIYPNPTDEQVHIVYWSKVKGMVVLEVYDTGGKQVSRQRQRVQPGDNKFNLSTAQLASGVYVVRATAKSGEVSERLVK